MEATKYCFELEFCVRDYECDLQGIVNNAVYQYYLEHARHEYIKEIGLDFAELHNDGIDAVVYRIELDYKYPLTSGDKFVVKLFMEREGRVRFVFNQDIYKLPTGETIIKAKAFTTFTKNGRPTKPPVEFENAFV